MRPRARPLCSAPHSAQSPCVAHAGSGDGPGTCPVDLGVPQGFGTSCPTDDPGTCPVDLEIDTDGGFRATNPIAQGFAIEPVQGCPDDDTTDTDAGPRWVLIDTQALEGENIEGFGRTEGSLTVVTIANGTITKRDREVDNDIFYWDWTWTFTFDPPPDVLTPGETITLSAEGSRTGEQPLDGFPGAEFQFYADGQILGDSLLLGGTGGPASGQISTDIPVPGARDGTFEIEGFLWNCGPCDIIWTYEIQELQ